MAYPQQGKYGPSGYSGGQQRRPIGPQQEYGRNPYAPGQGQQPRYGQHEQYGQRPAQHYPSSQQQQDHEQRNYHDQYQSGNDYDGRNWDQGDEQYDRHDYSPNPNGHGAQHSGFDQSYSEGYGYQDHSYDQRARLRLDGPQHGAQEYATPSKPWMKPQRSYSSGDAQGVERQAVQAAISSHAQSGNAQQSKSPIPSNNLQIPKKPGRDRILNKRESPKNLAWDNPFPVFPSNTDKKKEQSTRVDVTRPSTASSSVSRDSGKRSFDTQRSSGRATAQDSRRDDASVRSGSQLQSITESSYQHQAGPHVAGSMAPPRRLDETRPGTAEGTYRLQNMSFDGPKRSFTMPDQIPRADVTPSMPIREKSDSSTRSYDIAQPRINPTPQPPSAPASQQYHQPMRSNSPASREPSYGSQSGPYSHSSQGGRSREGSTHDGSVTTSASSSWQPYARPGLSLPTSPEEEEDMPNFGAADAERKPSTDKELHMGPRQEQHPPRPAPSSYDRGRQHDPYFQQEHSNPASRSQSQTGAHSSRERQNDNYYGLGFGDAADPPSTTRQSQDQPSRQQSYDTNRPPSNASAQSIRQRNMAPSPGPSAPYGPPPPNGRPRGPPGPPLNVSRAMASNSARNSPMASPVDRRTPISATRPSNPDALPYNPLPEARRPNQTPVGGSHPPPIRQYTASPQGPQIAPPTPGPAAGPEQPVTQQELQQLRNRAHERPNDHATQLLLARKLVEASAVLVDPRADAKVKSKARERYATEACRIIKKLVAHGDAAAMFFLADKQTALGLPKDPKEAFTLYQSAAKLNHAQAAYRVAVCCELGQDDGGGTRRDPLKAVQWYQRAAQLGDPPAMYKLGMIQLKGLLGQPRDPGAALPWLEQAAARADAENPHALHELGLLFEGAASNVPPGVVPQDLGRARQMFLQAAELGYKFSQYRLGAAHEHGSLGCPVDARQSIVWYSKAAQQEEHQSELALAGWYLTGADGAIAQSDQEAYLWARKAAQAGLAKAEYAMGYFTEAGIGVPGDLEAAKRWYWKAASQNFPKARERLEDLRRGGGRVQKSRISRSTVQKSDGDCVIM